MPYTIAGGLAATGWNGHVRNRTDPSGSRLSWNGTAQS